MQHVLNGQCDRAIGHSFGNHFICSGWVLILDIHCFPSSPASTDKLWITELLYVQEIILTLILTTAPSASLMTSMIWHFVRILQGLSGRNWDADSNWKLAATVNCPGCHFIYTQIKIREWKHQWCFSCLSQYCTTLSSVYLFSSLFFSGLFGGWQPVEGTLPLPTWPEYSLYNSQAAGLYTSHVNRWVCWRRSRGNVTKQQQQQKKV